MTRSDGGPFNPPLQRGSDLKQDVVTITQAAKMLRRPTKGFRRTIPEHFIWYNEDDMPRVKMSWIASGGPVVQEHLASVTPISMGGRAG